MSGKIMVLEDEKVTQEMIKKSIGKEYDLHVCGTLAEARAHLKKHRYDLVILDRMLPDGDGIEICQELRGAGHTQLPIIFLSSKNQEPDKVVGLYAGADDYVVKPFGPLELKARVQARLRNTSESLKINDVTLDVARLQAYQVINGENTEISLTRLEFKLLMLFMQNPDHVYSRTHLLDKVWGEKMNVSDRVVDTHLSHLRKKLSNTTLTIQSVHGEGYRLEITTGAKSA